MKKHQIRIVRSKVKTPPKPVLPASIHKLGDEHYRGVVVHYIRQFDALNQLKACGYWLRGKLINE